MRIERSEMRATAQGYIRLLMGIQRREAERHGTARLSETQLALMNLSAWLLHCPADDTPVTAAEFWQYEALINAASVAFNAYVETVVNRDKTAALHAYHAASDQLYAARRSDDETFTAAARQFVAARDRLDALVKRNTR